MSGKNLIVARNPARRRKSRRTAKQKAASRRNIRKAIAARRRGRGSRKRRRNVTTYRRASNPNGSRSNPRARLPSFRGIINSQVIPAAIGGAGAVLDDLLVNLIPLPANLKVGWMRHVTKAVGAVLIGYVGAMFLTRRTADQLGAGAMTVVGYNVVRDMAGQFLPQLPLAEYLDMPLSEYLDPSLGYYGAGLNPSGIPGSGLETAGQFTRGSPYIDPGMGAWPTGGAYEDLEY